MEKPPFQFGLNTMFLALTGIAVVLAIWTAAPQLLFVLLGWILASIVVLLCVSIYWFFLRPNQASRTDLKAARWLRFRRRGFVALLTMSCLMLGWKIDLAQRRGRAIDAILGLDTRAVILYKNRRELIPIVNFEDTPSDTHFWLDLKDTPVQVQVQTFNPEVGAALSLIHSIDTIVILPTITDADLPYLEQVDAREIDIESNKITLPAVKKLQRAIPSTAINVPLSLLRSRKKAR